MSKKKILVPTDLRDVSQVAVDYACMLAKKSGQSITLLHIHDDKTWSAFAIENKLRNMCSHIRKDHGLQADYLIREGKLLKEIPETANWNDYSIAIITTHGIRGFKQKMLGADILKLVREISIPVLVVQEDSKLPDGGFQNIVFPVGGHPAFGTKVEATVAIAGLCDPEISLYSITRPGDQWTEQLKQNLELAKTTFDGKGIRYKRVAEDVSVYSVGYARQTLEYAKKSGADLFVIMSVPTAEHYYFAQADKETLLTNELNIPVLCTSGKDLT